MTEDVGSCQGPCGRLCFAHPAGCQRGAQKTSRQQDQRVMTVSYEVRELGSRSNDVFSRFWGVERVLNYYEKGVCKRNHQR